MFRIARPFLVPITLIMMLGVFAVACAAPTAAPAPTAVPAPTLAPAPTQAPAPTTAPAAAVEITWLSNEEPEELEVFEEAIQKFEAANPGITVKVVNVPEDEDFNARLAADIAAGTPPDVFAQNYRFVTGLAAKGVIEPLGSFIATSTTVKPEDYYPVALNAFKVKGEQFCLPLNLSQLQVYYNKKMFQDAGVALPTKDWTRADFVAAAKALTKDTNGDGKADQYGLGVAQQLLRLAPFVWADSGDIVDNPERPTKLTLNSGAALAAFEWFVSLQTKEHVVPTKEDEATESSQSRFQHGTLGMFLQSRVITPELRETIKNFEWDIAPLPVGKSKATVLHSDGFCMLTASKHKAETWKFIEFITGPAGQTVLSESGRVVPSLKAVANSEAFLNSHPPANNQVYLDMADHVRPLPLMTTWSEVEGVVNKEIKRAFYGDATVQEAAQAAVDDTAEYFKQNLADLGSP